MEQTDQPILSICIPTYNRCDILVSTLSRHVSDTSFNEVDVEIIISDNCSTDNTEQVCMQYAEKYRNIHYYKLSENIGADRNAGKVLSLAKGKYIKLMNDYAYFGQGKLGKMIEVIKSTDESYALFFYNNIYFIKGSNNSCVHVSNLDAFVTNVSAWLTWIGNFGSWRKDFELLENKNRMVHLNFPQMDWTLRLVKPNTLIYFDRFYLMESVNRKGGFNYFEVFLNNYFSLYKYYIDNNLINQSTFAKEKKRYFNTFVISGLYHLYFNKKFQFDKKDSMRIVFYHYKSHLYYYFGFLKLPIFFLLDNKYGDIIKQRIKNKRA